MQGTKTIIEKYTEEIKEVEEFLDSRGKESESIGPISIEQIKVLVESGILPQEAWDHYCQFMKKTADRFEEIKKLKERNPDLSQEKLLEKLFPLKELTKEEIVELYEDTAHSVQFLKFLLENRHLLETKKYNRTLFNNVDVNKGSMGIVQALSDSLYHLNKILNGMMLQHLYEHQYTAKGSTENTLGETITLEYEFRASSAKDAQDALEEYKNIMVKKGLRTWMAFWCSANEKGRVEYKCTLTEVMKWTAGEDRDSYFTQKEKEEFWNLTRMLEKTKLSRSKKVKKSGKTGDREFIAWIEQPLVQIVGGYRPAENDEKLPLSIDVRVLMPKMQNNGFAPALYSTSTLKLNPNDFLLAFLSQTRATKRGRGTKDLYHDWEMIFEAGNLQKTATYNPREAKAKARKKMARIQERGIIENWSEDLRGIHVIPKKQKMGSKSEGAEENLLE